jgi:hypothetical protein
MIERFDFVFSYWIFAWFILYELKITHYNPKIALIIGLLVNVIELSTMIYYKNSFSNIFLFSLINFIFKVVPLWILRKTEYKVIDVYADIGLFIIYLFWLFINNVNIRKESTNLVYKIKHNKPVGPIMYYVNKNNINSI